MNTENWTLLMILCGATKGFYCIITSHHHLAVIKFGTGCETTMFFCPTMHHYHTGTVICIQQLEHQDMRAQNDSVECC